MTDESADTLVCEMLSESHRLSLGQICRACAVDAEWIEALVDHGVITPEHENPTQAPAANIRPGTLRWQFTATHLARARRAARLHRDLAVNMAGLALALDLMDEIAELRERLDAVRERPF